MKFKFQTMAAVANTLTQRLHVDAARVFSCNAITLFRSRMVAQTQKPIYNCSALSIIVGVIVQKAWLKLIIGRTDEICLVTTYQSAFNHLRMTLEEKTDQLLRLVKLGRTTECVFALSTAVKYSAAKIIINKSDLVDFVSFESRFQHLLEQGYSWINLNAAGAWKNKLIVIVELPASTSRVPKESVAVNLSGPSGQNLEIN